MKKTLLFAAALAFFAIDGCKAPQQIAVAPPAPYLMCRVCGPLNEHLWVAKEDEPGPYSNETTGTDKYDGRNNTGGEANDLCRCKGAGWYLPSIKELEAIYKVGSFRSMFRKGNYWSSTQYDGKVLGKTTDAYGYFYIFNSSAYTNLSISNVRPGMADRGKKHQRFSVHCFWKPDTSKNSIATIPPK
jgi:hypothetical protein